MSIKNETLKFSNRRDAERWIEQVKEQWQVTGSEINPAPDMGAGWYAATVTCPVRSVGGKEALIPVQRDES